MDGKKHQTIDVALKISKDLSLKWYKFEVKI